MNKQVLQIKYHPAKKEVEFHRFQNGQEVAIRNDSRLMHYMNLKGKFVLQDHGNAFFSDIANAFDGLKTVEMQVITTKMDYEDLVQMVEYYNGEPGGCKINTTLLAELPDMNHTFSEVKKYGERAVGVLQSHRQKFFNIPLEKENVKKSAESFARQIDEEIRNIREKIDSLSDNSVSLCFTGVYSAGKSALINAILGYRILPEDIKSETAKMFQISSPQSGENVKIKFEICSVVSELEWNDESGCFEFSKGPSESIIRTEIQKVLNTAKDEKAMQHDQIKRILNDLNTRQEVSSEIKVAFPVSLDNENVQFTIYDTPGTDSNYLAHQQVLNEALEEQRQSILIFVAKPDGLEGTGNNALLNYLKAAEEKNSKTSIDIGRSLFVINKADGQTSDARVTLQHQEIKNRDDENFSIKLADKKLFFTSALYAYAAKAVANGIATSQEQGLLEAGKYTLALEQNPMGYCYRQDRCATSEYTTEKMMQKCETALKEAQEKDDIATVLSICSGLYALESEILQYGEKYASAVKAFSIIDSVNRALTKLNNRANSLKDSNQEKINVIESNIAELKNTISSTIEEEYNNVAIPANVAFPEETRKVLKLDKDTLNHTIVGHTKMRLDKILKGWLFGLGKVKVKDSDKDKVRDIIDEVIDNFTNGFLEKRKNLLEEQRDNFMKAVKAAIMQNGRISESAKKYFLDIPEPMVSKLSNIHDVEKIYDSHRRTDKTFVFESEYLDKNGFIRDVEGQLIKVAGLMSDDYSKDYRKALETLLMQIKSQFESNLAEYSLYMRAMIENKEAMKQLGNKVEDAANTLKECQNQLNTIIWKETKHV